MLAAMVGLENMEYAQGANGGSEVHFRAEDQGVDLQVGIANTNLKRFLMFQGG